MTFHCFYANISVMKRPNNVVVEQGVPKSELSRERINGFYDELQWLVADDSEFPDLTYVQPDTDSPFACYWQTTTEDRVAGFVDNPTPTPSRYSVGPKLPNGLRVTEVGLVVPTDMVPDIWEKGGKLMIAHAYRPLQEYCGTYDFRFTDPFGLAYRVTGDPGYEP